MKTTAQKWGNSLAIRVPKSIAEQAGLKVKDDLDIEVRKGTLVLRPHLRRVYRLEDLVKRMTPRNMHKELDFGGPVGRETPNDEHAVPVFAYARNDSSEMQNDPDSCPRNHSWQPSHLAKGFHFLIRSSA